jgi:hypothetical protein
MNFPQSTRNRPAIGPLLSFTSQLLGCMLTPMLDITHPNKEEIVNSPRFIRWLARSWIAGLALVAMLVTSVLAAPAAASPRTALTGPMSTQAVAAHTAVPQYPQSLLFYNATARIGAIGRFDSAGYYHYVGPMPPVAQWTHMVGTGSGSLFFYNASTRVGATGRFDSTSQYHYVSIIPGFGEWTHIAATSGGHLLFYNSSTGTGATGRVDSAGYYHYVSPLSGFGEWTHIVGT